MDEKRHCDGSFEKRVKKLDFSYHIFRPFLADLEIQNPQRSLLRLRLATPLFRDLAGIDFLYILKLGVVGNFFRWQVVRSGTVQCQ